MVGWLREKIGVVALVAMVLMLHVGIWTAAVDAAVADDATEYVPGRPLDATVRDAPTFAEGKRCYHVTDRASGASWWLIKMELAEGEAQWVALPIVGGDER